MVDPLSIAASVIGLINAGAKITKVLVQVTKNACDAPNDCRRLKDEVETIRYVLSQLQLFFTGQSRTTRSRTSLILVDQVVVTLAACVTTFSDLDVFAENLQSEVKMGILDRLRWSSKEDEIRHILQRVESHKSSLTLIMTILTCEKQGEAEDKVDVLCTLVQKVLEQHEFLHHRLTAIELHQLGYITDIGPDLDSVGDIGALPDSSTVAESANEIRNFAFEEVLNHSRPYLLLDARDLGLCSRSEVSHISILAIPIYPGDISNSDAYVFEPAYNIGHHGPPQDPAADNLHKPTSSSSSSTTYPLQTDEKSKWSVRLKLKGLIRGPARRHETSSAVFYVPLKESVMLVSYRIGSSDDNGNIKRWANIPLVVATTGNFIKAQGMLEHKHPQLLGYQTYPISECGLTSIKPTIVNNTSADIFIRGGNPKRMMKLQDTFNTPPRYGRGHSWSGFTPHDAAGIMLRYLKSLPEPVIPYQSYSAFAEVGKLHGLSDAGREETVLQTLVRLITALPAHNRALLLYLVDIMYVFEGLMPIERLVAAFQPSILSKPPDVMDDDLERAANNAVRLMVSSIERPGFLDTINGLVDVD
ncbi:RhoGAP domain containing protein [Rhypophila decipiens]